MERDTKEDFFFMDDARNRFVFMSGVTVGGLRCTVLVGVFSSLNSNCSFLFRVNSGVIVIVGDEDDFMIMRLCFLINGDAVGDGLRKAADVLTAIDFVLFGDDE